MSDKAMSGPVALTVDQITAGLWNSSGYDLLPGQFTYSIPTATSSFPGYPLNGGRVTRLEPTTQTSRSRRHFLASPRGMTTAAGDYALHPDTSWPPNTMRLIAGDASPSVKPGADALASFRRRS